MECFGYVCSKFPKVSETNLKEEFLPSKLNENCYPTSSFSKEWGTKKKEHGTPLRMLCTNFWGILKSLSTTIVQFMLKVYGLKTTR